jgi:hypothetical protein
MKEPKLRYGFRVVPTSDSRVVGQAYEKHDDAKKVIFQTKPMLSRHEALSATAKWYHEHEKNRGKEQGDAE